MYWRNLGSMRRVGDPKHMKLYWEDRTINSLAMRPRRLLRLPCPCLRACFLVHDISCWSSQRTTVFDHLVLVRGCVHWTLVLFFWFALRGGVSTFFALAVADAGIGCGGRPARTPKGGPALFVPRAVDGAGGCLGRPLTPPSSSALRFAPEIWGCWTNGLVAV